MISAPRFRDGKKLSFIIALTGASLLVSMPTISSEVPANRHISTTGYGEVRAKPDTVVLQLQVSATERNGAAAKQEVDAHINRFLAASDQAQLDREQITAGQLQINPQWEYRDQERVFTGYQASRNLNVQLQDLERLSSVIDMALDSGINNVLQLSYEHSEADQLTQQAHQAAVTNSKAKAQALAAAYGGRLGLVYAIHYQRANIELPPPVRAEAAFMRASADSAGNGVYLQDEIVFSDTIKVVFNLTFAD